MSITRILTMVIVASLVHSTSVCAPGAEPEGPISIGSRLELLLDDYLIESMQRKLSFRMHSPQMAERVLHFDAPWELGCDYVTVFKDDDLYRMYYASHLGIPESYSGENQVTCYAESRDGIQWTKPSLGLVEFQGSKDNNIVLYGGDASHNFAPFIDTKPGIPASERYKAVGGNNPGPYIFASADAIHWRRLEEEPLSIEGKFDSQNVAFWDPHQQQYLFYFRIKPGYRYIALSTSQDFRNWTSTVPIDVGNAPRQQLYTNATIPYFRAPHVYLSFPMRYFKGFPTLLKTDKPIKPKGISDGVFMFSRDGLHFDRRYLEAFIRPGISPRNWTKHSVMTSWGLLATAEDEISVYILQHYHSDTAHLRRGVLRTDGFVSLHAAYSGGEFTTRPLTFSGNRLVLNVSTSAAGSVRVEIQDADGNPLDGYHLKDSQRIYGDTIRHIVHWQADGDVSALAGTPVRLRFVMRDADLYSLRFAEDGP